MIVKLFDNIEAWSALRRDTFLQALRDGQDGIFYRLAEFSINDTHAPYYWWGEPNRSPTPEEQRLQLALKRAAVEETVYLFHGAAHVPGKTHPHQVQPGHKIGVPLRQIFQLSLRQREASVSIQIPPEPDLGYFRATAELPGVFVATFNPPPPTFWQIKPSSGFQTANHLDVSIIYAQDKRHERYLINVDDRSVPFFDARALGKMLAFRKIREQAVMEFHDASHWILGRNRTSASIPLDWLRVLNSSSSL